MDSEGLDKTLEYVSNQVGFGILSSLNSFLYQPQFRSAKQSGNFERWTSRGLDRFYKLEAHGPVYGKVTRNG